MENKKKVFSNILKYSFLFLLFLFGLIVSYNMFFGDSIANLGFSYAITKGEVPYNDFNLVIPLFSPFLYAIPLFFFHNSLVFYATQALLLTILFYLLEKKLKHKVYIFFLIVSFCFPLSLVTGLFPGYNFLLFFLIVLLGYLEKCKINDIVIGIILGLCILTKHTIGVFLILPSIIFYYKNLKKLLLRFVGLLIPCFVFLIYLIITKSFWNFMNLCVFGLFDFASKNSTNNNIFLIVVAFLCLIYFLVVLFKKRDIDYFYLFLTILFIFPLFDDYHLSYFIFATLYVLLDRSNISKRLMGPSCFLAIVVIGIWTYISMSFLDYKFVNYSYYPMRYMSNVMEIDYKYLDSVVNKYKKMNLFLLGTENYFYKMNNDMKLTYYDLPNYGNYGYNGFDMMKKRIDNEHDTYFVVSLASYNDKAPNQQYYKELVKYIFENGNFVEKNKDYSVYYFE